MTTREAGIKLTLDSGTFTRGIDAIGDKAVAVGRKIKSGLSAGFKGVGGEAWKGGGDALKEMTGSIKSAVGAAATLGGGIGFGMLIHKASNLREKVRDIEFQINKTGRATTSWQEVLATTQQAASETGKSSEEMANIYQGLFATTGDADFAAKALIPIGHAATASGQDINKLADAAQMLQRKFGATAETLPEMLAAFVEKTDAGGLSLDSLGNKFALMAGEAAEAGFKGKDGLNTLLGMMTMLDSRVGEKSEQPMKKLFQLFKDGGKDLKALSKETGLKFEPDMSAMEKLRRVLGSEKGRAKLTEKLGGESRVVFDELSKPFNEAFDKAKSEGAKTKAATEQGLKAWDAAMASLGKSTINYARLVDESKQGQEEDPQARLNAAIEKIAQKFSEPKMLDAVDRLAETLPRVADGMVKVVDFVTKHPLMSGGLFVGAKLGGGMLSGATSKLGENAGAAMTGAMKNVGKDLAKDLASTMAQGAAGWGHLMGKAVGISAGALIAYEIGKAIIDSRIEEKNESQRQSVAAGIEGMNAVNSGDLQAAVAAKEKLEAMSRQQADELANNLTDAVFDGLAGMIDSDYKSQGEQQLAQTYKDLATLNEAITALTAKMNGAAKTTEGMAEATKKAGQAAGGAANAFFNVGGGTVPTETTGGGATKGPGGVANPGKPGYLF